VSFLQSWSPCWSDQFDLILSIQNPTPVSLSPSLSLSVCDVPIEPALLWVSFLEIPTSTWVACSTASTSRCLPFPVSCQLVMYGLKNFFNPHLNVIHSCYIGMPNEVLLQSPSLLQ
jgi:hypothetical protein